MFWLPVCLLRLQAGPYTGETQSYDKEVNDEILSWNLSMEDKVAHLHADKDQDPDKDWDKDKDQDLEKELRKEPDPEPSMIEKVGHDKFMP